MSDFNLYQTTPRQRQRAVVDRLARWGVTAGGMSVILAIVLIFAFLLSVVLPIFVPASVESVAEFSQSQLAKGKTRYIGLSENGEIAFRFSEHEPLQFFHSNDGSLIKNFVLPWDGELKRVIPVDKEGHIFALLNNDNQLILVEIGYLVTFESGERELIPRVSYPYGEEPVAIDSLGDAEFLNVERDEEGVTLVYLNSTNELQFAYYLAEEGDELNEVEFDFNMALPFSVDYLLVNDTAELVLLLSKQGELLILDIKEKDEPVVLAKQSLLVAPIGIQQAEFLVGGSSLMLATSDHRLTQWTLQRTEQGDYRMVSPRDFELSGDATALITEARRKGLLVFNAKQQLTILHTTGQTELITTDSLFDKADNITLTSRSDAFLAEINPGEYRFFEIDNEHPEVTWHALWQEVWYEGYDSKEYIWQSSSADDDFEPKFSLVPLTFGTFKAAFYAMLIAMPIAIMGAIYTAYFMTPMMRNWVKPGIEIMEALPTVILGFLAGLWLAPALENHLVAIFSLVIIVPVSFLLTALVWQLMPSPIRHLIPSGWEAAMLMPVTVVAVFLSFEAGPLLESALFDNNIQLWLQENLGINYDQRNSLVVGIAMGLAVIPTIFSITEDAVYSVPQHLTEGSLALGATPWQTLTKVVILTASPGIFSAVMIGLGRAVGETMIVLMATGNTPIMDFSVFQGMRTLSANIAVELPESEVDSSHYRILFLAALVLFGATFIFNTAAETVRQRLRARYSNL
ncbi:MAG: ABC transporter permease subunit [Pseudomonadales bacterium]|nr:ABC transporter permease subunit [Pseudomonadales bacterium]